MPSGPALAGITLKGLLLLNYHKSFGNLARICEYLHHIIQRAIVCTIASDSHL